MSRSTPLNRNLALLLVLLTTAGMTYYHLGLFMPRALQNWTNEGLGGGYHFGDDFYPIWLTTREAFLHHRDPYTRDMTRDIQTGLFGRPLDARISTDPDLNYRAYAYPAYVNLLFWPFSSIPFPKVRIILAVALAVLTALSVPLWITALRLGPGPRVTAMVTLFTLSSYAAIEGLFATQLGLLVSFLLAATFAALTKHRLFLAGSLFAFTFIKPQMSALVGVYLLIWTLSEWRSRRAFLLGVLSWSSLLVVASLVVWPHWIPEWLGVLSGYGAYAHPPLLSFSLGPKLGPRLGPFLIAALLLAGVILMFKVRKATANSPAFLLTVSLLLALTSITLLPGQAVHDHLILLPGILFAAYRSRKLALDSRPFRIVLLAASLALFWQWITAIPLLVIRYFISPATFFSVLRLPLHAAASVPLGITAVLSYLMLQVLRENRAQPQTDSSG